MAISSRNLCRSLVTQEPKGEEQALILDAVSKNTREAQILPSQNSPGHNVKPAPLGPVAHPIDIHAGSRFVFCFLFFCVALRSRPRTVQGRLHHNTESTGNRILDSNMHC